MARILHLVPGAPYGGAQRLAIELAVKQRAAGDQADVLFLNQSDIAHAAAAKAGITALSAGKGAARIFTTRKLARQADTLHLHLPPPWLAPILPIAPTKILHIHVRPSPHSDERNLRRKLDNLGLAMLIRRMNGIIAVSDWAASSWSDVYGPTLPPVSVVYNGIDLLDARATPPAPFTIGMVCRLTELRGVEEFIALAKNLHEAAPEIRFRIAGDGPDQAKFAQMVQDTHLAANVEFCGFVTDMRGFWDSIHLAAYTAPLDTFGLRIVEPLAHGVPVAGYRNGTGSDEVIDQCRGVIAAPYGEVEHLAKRILTLRGDLPQQEKLVREGREDIAQNFSQGAMVKGVSAAYTRFRK